ncbi:MAG: type I restriction-modification enzyme R subunit C-terminal domain-containing protein, partial [Polyangiales bacterium]
IAVTVDLLSTGVDVPDLEVIVFLRFVRSRILFVQMLGRGTRKSDNLPDKSHFTVVDAFNGSLVRYFRAATDMTEAPPDKPSRPIGKVIDDIWANRDRAYQIRCLVKRLQRIDKEMSGEARDLFAAWVPDGDLAAFAKALPSKLASDFTATMKLLRDEGFKKLLVDHPRPRRVFTIAEHQTDTVQSEWLVHGLDGKEYKPVDYLTVFETYVRDNPDQITAIEILLDAPKRWSGSALSELRTRLKTAGPGFDERVLLKAHQIRYDKALVDIISMVKHAARSTEALLSAEERVARAFDAITAAKTFTPEQQSWLSRIRAHLVKNLSLDATDFDIMPALFDYGGYEAANEDFDGALDALIERINEAVAA